VCHNQSGGKWGLIIKILCDQCKNEFTSSDDQMEHIVNSLKKEMTFIMVRCSLCSKAFPLNPLTMQIPELPEKKIGDGLRCPYKTCHSYISFIEDKPSFWGCGECGNVWFEKEKLFRDIEEISKKYSYRKMVYKKEGDGFVPVSSKNEPKNYEQLVEKEWDG
jgi:hypothetical protein